MAPFLIFILASVLSLATSASLGNNTDPTLTITAKPSYGCSTICQAFGAPDRCSLEMETGGMSEELSKVMLDKHNQLRRRLAKGEEENWPSAANMRKLVWSEELASSAQEQAEQCNPDGTFDVPRAEFVGISMLSDPGSNWTMTMDDFEKIVQHWYALKVDSFDFVDIPNFGGTGISAGNATFSANTKAVGCGLVIHSRENWRMLKLSCFYDGPGGHNSDPIYEEGPPCSSCQPGFSCDDGLCASGNPEVTTTESGSTESGSTASGSTESGSTEGESTESGSTESGSTESGSTESGSTESGSTESGSTESGSTESGSTEGESTGTVSTLEW